jgi:hypothetical protein
MPGGPQMEGKLLASLSYSPRTRSDTLCPAYSPLAPPKVLLTSYRKV